MPIYSQEKSARVAYETYANTVGGRTWDDRPMPTWETLPMKQKDAWTKAVSAAVDEFNRFLIESEAVTYSEHGSSQPKERM